MKTLISLLFLAASYFTQAQPSTPLVIKDSVKIEMKIEKHLWEDNNTYQFIAISISGLPEINTFISREASDSINSLIIRDSFGGGYGPVIPMSRNKTFYPVHTIKEIVYDSISKINAISEYHLLKHTSLFLLDDFDDIKNKDTLILFSRGCFGYQRQSYAACDNFTVPFIFDKSSLQIDNDFPIADENWYNEWLKSEPEEHSDARTIYNYGDIHKGFEFYLEKN
ncbi:hypothetical protein [Winogradskyella forsetii]|uniref:hypothetical protein n=1 Tax=Winogradskyella forsetii TaxID=2686077 RepID=UPI0015B8C746|nr:hypothetical protein [Winogradskyella forsetii]